MDRLDRYVDIIQAHVWNIPVVSTEGRLSVLPVDLLHVWHRGSTPKGGKEGGVSLILSN